MRLVRVVVLFVGLGLVLAVANRDIRSKEQVIENGRLVLLELRPVDPRSMMQGDYMALRYAPAAFPELTAIERMAYRGTVIMTADAAGVARFARLDDGTALGAGEFRLRYRRQQYYGELRYGADSFFFEEGAGPAFAAAVYGMLRVDDDGDMVLVGLADKDHRRLEAGPIDKP